jgi:hypothetical protein
VGRKQEEGQLKLLAQQEETMLVMNWEFVK